MTTNEINKIIESVGVSTKDENGLYAEITSDNKIRMNDANNYMDLPSDTDAEGIKAFVQGWKDAVGS